MTVPWRRHKSRAHPSDSGVTSSSATPDDVSSEITPGTPCFSPHVELFSTPAPSPTHGADVGLELSSIIKEYGHWRIQEKLAIARIQERIDSMWLDEFMQGW